ncbi:MAG: ATP synthase F1 subunit gamma [Clostridia bacterium]|nr:ATP synthase F1 subunit gamma [Clostridia bacterium]
MAVKNINEINRDLDAIYQTRHVTNAMYMLSASAMRQGMERADYNRAYMRYVCTAVKDLLEKSPDVRNAFIDSDGYLGKHDTAFLVIASDKSLCGAYNQNVAAVVEAQLQRVRADGRETVVYTAGLKIAEILRARGVEIYRDFEGASQYPSMHHVYTIAQELIDIYRCGFVRDIYVVFTEYESAAKQSVIIHRLLPLVVENFETIPIDAPYPARMTYEPSSEEVFNKMVPQYLQGYLYGCFCSAQICENLSRMEAMQSATRNADEMIKKLTTAYNTARQLTITSELTEIAAATELIRHSV